MIFKFDVFGTLMSIHKKEDEWLLFKESDTGIRSRIYDVVIPPDLETYEFAKYLDDIYHEYSSERHPSVKQIG